MVKLDNALVRRSPIPDKQSRESFPNNKLETMSALPDRRGTDLNRAERAGDFSPALSVFNRLPKRLLRKHTRAKCQTGVTFSARGPLGP